MKNPTYALVTGASQGLERVFARELAGRKQNVILVARSGDKLKSLAIELLRSQSVLAEAVEFDLAAPSAGPRLAQQIRDRKLQVNLLVNNAGFGGRGEFRNVALQRQVEMLSLYNVAVVELTYSLLPSLIRACSRGNHNVSSTAGFQPIPYASLYAATKSFLTSFSLGLQEELRSSGVSVVTLCPGWILAEDHSGEAKNGNRKFGFIYQSAEDVVRDALESLANGGDFSPRYIKGPRPSPGRPIMDRLGTKILYMNAKSFRCNPYEKTGVARLSNLAAELLKLLYQLAYLLFKLFVLDAAMGKSRAQSGVKLECSCSPNNFGDIRAADSRAGDNDDPFQSSFDKFGEHGGSLQRTFRAAGRQDSFRASLDHIFERLVKITCLVECSVIRHRQWLCKFNEFPCALNVDAMVFRQDAQNEAIHSGFFGVRDRAPHL